MDSHGTRVLGGLAGPWSPWAAIQSRPVRIVLGFCAFELAFICAYHYGMTFDPVIATIPTTMAAGRTWKMRPVLINRRGVLVAPAEPPADSSARASPQQTVAERTRLLIDA